MTQKQFWIYAAPAAALMLGAHYFGGPGAAVCAGSLWLYGICAGVAA